MAGGTILLEELPTEEAVELRARRAPAPPRLFGVAPPLALVALVAGLLTLALVLLATDHRLAGLVILGVDALFAAPFAQVVRRLPATQAARALHIAVRGGRTRARSFIEALAADADARATLSRLSHELAALTAARADALRTLGEAVYGKARDRAETATARVRELENLIAAKEAEMERIVSGATERIRQAQFEIESTLLLEPPEPAPMPEPYPPPAEPPQPVHIPEPSPVPSEPAQPVYIPEPSPVPSPPSPQES